MEATAARVRTEPRGHWYHPNGEPCHTVPKKSGAPGETRPTTLADARKLNLLPSVTTYLRILAKPELDAWKAEQVCLAVLTSPQLPGEGLDAYVHRVLKVDKEQAQEAKQKADLGKRIHAALASNFAAFKPFAEDMRPYCNAPYLHIMEKLRAAEVQRIRAEHVLVGHGYAGCTDLIAECAEKDILIDWKTTGTLPEKGSWLEHKLQLAAYAAAWFVVTGKPIVTANLYISSKEPGKYVYWENPDWLTTYERGFSKLVDFHAWMTGYDPRSAMVGGSHAKGEQAA
jgi:PD-(D/E)XK nuclease superfamily